MDGTLHWWQCISPATCGSTCHRRWSGKTGGQWICSLPLFLVGEGLLQWPTNTNNTNDKTHSKHTKHTNIYVSVPSSSNIGSVLLPCVLQFVPSLLQMAHGGGSRCVVVVGFVDGCCVRGRWELSRGGKRMDEGWWLVWVQWRWGLAAAKVEDENSEWPRGNWRGNGWRTGK